MKVEEIIHEIYSFILWVNVHIFEPLNKSVRMDAFIGILSVLIAIVIFIAETINDKKKTDTEKKFILEKTKMKNIMIFSIVILFIFIIKELIPYCRESNFLIQLCEKSDRWIQILFFIVELILNILVFVCICLTIKLFCVSIKLNTDSDYFFKEYNKYIERRLEKIHKKNLKYSSKRLKDEFAEKFVDDNKKYFSMNLDKKDEYIPIKSNKSGIFKCYSCRALQTLVDSIEEINSKSNKFILESEPLIILSLRGGEKINRGVTIAYCRKNIKGLDDCIRNAILFDDSVPFQDNEINLILNDMFILASKNKVDNYDVDNRLFNLYDFLYKNNMYALLDNSFEYIRKIYINSYNNLHTNKELVKFLSSLSHLAYCNEDFEHYKMLYNYMYCCYNAQLRLSKNVRDTSFDFTNTLFRYDYYSVKDNSDSVYYDVLMSYLLCFLFDLIVKKEFQAIDDLFRNIHFGRNVYMDGDIDDYDIIKIQFSFGFIYGLIILSNKNILKEKDKDNLKRLINNIKYTFIDIYDQEDAIYYYRKYYNKESNVQNTYSNFDFRFEEKRYRNSWSGIHIDDISILKEFIYVFDIDYCRLEDVNDGELISKDDIYSYERLLDMVNSNNKSNLEKILDINFNDKSLINLLEKLIEKCKKVEQEYIKENKLNMDKIYRFKDLIFEEIENGNELMLYLKQNNKYLLSNKKSQRLFGFKQIISRDLFFDEVYGIENISQDYGNSIISSISKEYTKKLDSISEVINKDFREYIKEIKDVENYVIITSPLNWKILDVNRFIGKKIKVGDKEVDLIRISKTKDIYLIKKQDMPILSMQNAKIKSSDKFKKNGIVCKLIDCSTDAKTRSEIQKNTKWLEEEGTKKEQIEFLKGNCVFELFVSPSIRKIPNSKCLKFIVKENGKFKE